jgi:hypothetical protein
VGPAREGDTLGSFRQGLSGAFGPTITNHVTHRYMQVAGISLTTGAATPATMAGNPIPRSS